MRRLAVVLMMLVSPALLASEYSDLYLIPIAGHVSGANGSVWMSDLSIHNIQSTPITVQLVVIESGEGIADNIAPLDSAVGSSVTIPANGTRILRDVLFGHRGQQQTIGAILAGADKPFAISSRAYIATAGGTQGQSITPLSNFVDNSLTPVDLSNAAASVTGLTSNSHDRTNLGFVAGSAQGMTFEVSLHGADGAELGTRTFTIPAGAFEHLQFSSTAITNQAFDEASATYRIVAGSGTLAPYASVVDNLSNGSFFVGSQNPPNAPFTSSALRALFTRLTR